MTLELPSGLEPFAGTVDRMHRPAVYVLLLDTDAVGDRQAAWDRVHDERLPREEWADYLTADTLAYVGSAQDLLERLTEHVRGNRRTTVLTEIYPVRDLHTVWWCEDMPRETRLAEERKLARMLRAERPNWYVRQQ